MCVIFESKCAPVKHIRKSVFKRILLYYFFLNFLAGSKRGPFLDEFEASQLGNEESEKSDEVTTKDVFQHEDYAFLNLLFSRGISMVLISVNFQANHEERVLKNLSRIQCQLMGFFKSGYLRKCKFLVDLVWFFKTTRNCCSLR